MSDTVILTEREVVVVDEAVTTIISVGTQGPMGTTTIGGYGFSVNTPVQGDVLMFDGLAWANIHKQTIADGGNF